MARVGLISIDLVANTGKLLAPLKRASAGISAFASGVTKVRLGFGTALASITAFTGGALSLAAAVGKVKHEFGQIDEIAKEAERLGTTTETLAGLRHAADLAGVSAEELGKSLQFMLKEGFSVADLGKIADQLRAIADPVERMQFAIKTFGRGGAGMINLLTQGSKGLADMAKEAERLGLTFSAIDAAKIDAADDAVTRLKAVFTGLARTIAIEIAPFVEVLANRMREFATSGESAGSVVRTAMDGIVTGIGFALDAVRMFQLGFMTLQAIATSTAGMIIRGFAEIAKAAEIAGEAIGNSLEKAFIDGTQFGLKALAKIAEGLAFLGSEAAVQLQKDFEALAKLQKLGTRGEKFDLDLGFGDAAREFADAFGESVAESWRSVMEFAGEESPSSKLRRDVERIRAEAEAAAAAAAGAPPGMEGSIASSELAALLRGSQDAFSAFKKAQHLSTSPEKEALSVAKKSERHLADIAKHTIIVRPAPL